MKVLDLQCAAGHTFEGWFGSEQDFVSQCQRALVQCPVCGESAIHKKLSAPRLNLSGARSPVESALAPQPESLPFPADAAATSPDLHKALQRAWAQVAKQVLADTHDVGDRFAEEARRIHYGETEERGIRGQATASEARELIEEGIELIALPIPEHLKKPLQ